MGAREVAGRSATPAGGSPRPLGSCTPPYALCRPVEQLRLLPPVYNNFLRARRAARAVRSCA